MGYINIKSLTVFCYLIIALTFIEKSLISVNKTPRKQEKLAKSKKKIKEKIVLRYVYPTIPSAVWLMPSETWRSTKKLDHEKPITVIIPSYKNAQWYIYNLDSIFAQKYENYRIIYIDDCSPDNTGNLVEEFIKSRKQEHRVKLIKNKEREGNPLANIYKAAHTLEDNEIMVVVDGDDWLAHNNVFQLLNEVYDDPQIWMTYGQYKNFPTEEIGLCNKFPSHIITTNKFRSHEWISSHLRTNYAWLFKQIKLEELLYQGHFYPMAGDVAYMLPMLELAGKRTKFISHINYIYNVATSLNEFKINNQLPLLLEKDIRSKQPEKPLQENSSLSGKIPRVELVIFSYHRPMQLTALLESTMQFIHDIHHVSIIYRADNDRYNSAYDKVKNKFPEPEWIKQQQPPHDFKRLLLSLLQRQSPDYILFTVDDIIVKDQVNLNTCIKVMRKTGAYGFYLRLGKNITESYMEHGKPSLMPYHIRVDEEINAWQFSEGTLDWKYPNNVDMTLYNFAEIISTLQNLSYSSPNTLESVWATQIDNNKKIGLCFDSSRIINVPINIVNTWKNRHMKSYTPEELLERFEKNYYLNIAPLIGIYNNSCHMEYNFNFTLRN